MIEACWIVLALVALWNPDARPQAFALSLMGGVQYVLLSLHPGMHAELGSLIIQIVAAGSCAWAIPAHRPLWSKAIVWLFIGSLSFQFVFWVLHFRGVNLGGLFYLIDQGVFTLQLMCAAWAAGDRDARVSRRHRRRRSRLGRGRSVTVVARTTHSADLGRRSA